MEFQEGYCKKTPLLKFNHYKKEAILMILTLITGQTCDAVVAQQVILLQINKGVSDE